MKSLLAWAVARGWRRGLLGGERIWLVVGAAALLLQWGLKAFRKEDEVVFSEKLGLGEQLIITHRAPRATMGGVKVLLRTLGARSKSPALVGVNSPCPQAGLQPGSGAGHCRRGACNGGHHHRRGVRGRNPPGGLRRGRGDGTWLSTEALKP